jgi:hypothetical protein
MEMVALIHHGRPVLLLPRRVDQGHAFLQAFAAVAHHLFQVRQTPELLGPGWAADLGAFAAGHPAQAFRLHHHQHRVAHVDLVRRRLAHPRSRPLIQDLQQLPRLLSGRLGAPAQRRHAQRPAGDQDFQEFPAVRQAHPAGLADGGELRLLVVVEDNGPGQAAFPFRLLLLQFAHPLPQAGVLLAPGLAFQGQRHPGGFAVDPLAADAALAGVAADVAVLTAQDGKGTGNPFPGSYHAHG